MLLNFLEQLLDHGVLQVPEVQIELETGHVPGHHAGAHVEFKLCDGTSGLRQSLIIS